jgi:cysteine synthase A
VSHRTISYPQALEGMSRYFDLTGMKIGTSAAANWLVATELAADLPPEARVVTVWPCAGQPGEGQAAGLGG